MFGKQLKHKQVEQLSTNEITFHGLVLKTTLNDIPIGVACEVSLLNETITLKAGSRSFSIQKSQILGAGTYGARTNAAGIVITGITGADSRQKITQHFYNYINFKSVSGETHQVDFEVYPPMRNVDLFIKNVNPQLSVVTAL